MKKNKILRVLSLGLIGASALGSLAPCNEKKYEPVVPEEKEEADIVVKYNT